MKAITDDDVILRVRTALDEVERTPVVTHQPAMASARSTTARTLTIAASLLLVIGGGAAVWAVTRNGGPSDAGQSAESPIQPATTPVPFGYVLADSVPMQTTTWAMEPATTTVVWAATADPRPRILVMRATPVDPQVSPVTGLSTTIRTVGDTALAFDAYGIDPVTLDGLIKAVEPGSGVPWVLPVDGWRMATMSSPGRVTSQTYENGLVFSARSDASGWMNVVYATSLESTVVAGQPGWKARFQEGGVTVMWPGADDLWYTLDIPTELVPETDALIANVQPST